MSTVTDQPAADTAGDPAAPVASVAPPAPVASAAPVAPPAPVASAAPVAGAPLAEESRGFGISSLVLGLVSILAGFTLVVPAGGLVLGILALKREPASRTMAIWGIVLNGVMLAGAVLATLVAVAFGLAVLPFLPFLPFAFS
jgi:hypothetical protein